MKTTMLCIALAAVASQAAAGQDSRIAELCGQPHRNEAMSTADIGVNHDGFYVRSLAEQVSFDDPRIVVTRQAAFHLCTQSVATAEMDPAIDAPPMHERTVRYLFVPDTFVSYTARELAASSMMQWDDEARQ